MCFVIRYRVSCILFIVFLIPYVFFMLITVAAQSEARTTFTHSNVGIVGSNPAQGMDDCVYVVLCLDSSLVTG
jgi:hypothetical protein